MDSIPASATARKHDGGWLTVIALGLLAFALLVCLFVLIGFPAEAEVNGSTGPHSNSIPAVSVLPQKPDLGDGGSPGAARREAGDEGVEGTAATDQTAHFLCRVPSRRRVCFDNPASSK
jgi:hypothetical protein